MPRDPRTTPGFSRRSSITLKTSVPHRSRRQTDRSKGNICARSPNGLSVATWQDASRCLPISNVSISEPPNKSVNLGAFLRVKFRGQRWWNRNGAIRDPYPCCDIGCVEVRVITSNISADRYGIFSSTTSARSGHAWVMPQRSSQCSSLPHLEQDRYTVASRRLCTENARM